MGRRLFALSGMNQILLCDQRIRCGGVDKLYPGNIRQCVCGLYSCNLARGNGRNPELRRADTS